MIWIVSIALLLSFSINFYLYRRFLRPGKLKVKSDKVDLHHAIDQVGKSGSALPDLSIRLTNLAASNLQSVDSFKRSSNELRDIISGSTTGFHKMDELGQQNIASVKSRINELQGFIESIEKLNEHNKSVTETVSVLEDISSQTSILALNASVEAARAGSQGKGFAVIAKSVRDLASKSLEASESIKELTDQSKKQGQKIADGVSQSSIALEEIFDNISQIIESLKEGLNSFEANTEIVNSIVESADNLDLTVQRNLRAVKESSQIGIKLGVHLDELYSESNYEGLSEGSEHEFIKPEHVFHFNFTNTLPALQKLKKKSIELHFPKTQDPAIKPQDVYRKLLSIFEKVNTKNDQESFKLVGDIKPMDVLRLSVQFCESIHKRSSYEMLDKQLIIEYCNWRQNRRVVPSDVLFLINHFDSIL